VERPSRRGSEAPAWVHVGTVPLGGVSCLEEPRPCGRAGVRSMMRRE
jgi:hypothetical protein